MTKDDIALACDHRAEIAGVEVVIGIDPGISGAIAVLSRDGRAGKVLDMPVADGNVTSRILYHRARRAVRARLDALVRGTQ